MSPSSTSISFSRSFLYRAITTAATEEGRLVFVLWEGEEFLGGDEGTTGNRRKGDTGEGGGDAGEDAAGGREDRETSGGGEGGRFAGLAAVLAAAVHAAAFGCKKEQLTQELWKLPIRYE